MRPPAPAWRPTSPTSCSRPAAWRSSWKTPRQTGRIQHDLLDVATKKADHGLGAQSDADQAAAQTAQTDAQIADLETQLHAARRTLLVLVGRGVEPLMNLEVPASVGTPPAIPASVPGQLLARRPDVREAAERITSAKGVMKLDKLALFPKFTLQPGLGLELGERIWSANHQR